MIFTNILEPTKTSVMHNSVKHRLHRYLNLCHTANQNYNFRSNFFLNILILLILKKSNSPKLSFRVKTVMLHILVISKKFILHAKPQKQRPTKSPFHYGQKLKTLLNHLPKKNKKLKQFGSTPLEKLIYGTIFLNPLIKKNDSIRIVLDARRLDSNTHQSFEYWPL